MTWTSAQRNRINWSSAATATERLSPFVARRTDLPSFRQWDRAAAVEPNGEEVYVGGSSRSPLLRNTFSYAGLRSSAISHSRWWLFAHRPRAFAERADPDVGSFWLPKAACGAAIDANVQTSATKSPLRPVMASPSSAFRTALASQRQRLPSPARPGTCTTLSTPPLKTANDRSL